MPSIELPNLKFAKFKNTAFWLKSPNLMPAKFSHYTVVQWLQSHLQSNNHCAFISEVLNCLAQFVLHCWVTFINNLSCILTVDGGCVFHRILMAIPPCTLRSCPGRMEWWLSCLMVVLTLPYSTLVCSHPSMKLHGWATCRTSACSIADALICSACCRYL